MQSFHAVLLTLDHFLLLPMAPFLKILQCKTLYKHEDTVIIYSTSMSYSLHLWFLLTTMNSFYEWLWMQHRFEFYVPNSENMTLNLSYIFSPRGDVFFIISFYALKVTLDNNYECVLEGWAFSNLFAVVIAGNCLLI